MQSLLLLLLVLSIGALQILVGGVTLAYALPVYCLLAVAGIAALASPGRPECARHRLFCVLSALVLAGYVAVRSFVSPFPHLAREDFYLVLGALVVYLLTAIHLSGSRQRLTIVWLLFLFAMLHVVVGATQFKRQDDWMLLPWVFRPVYWFRASGFYLSPNHLSGMLEMLGVMLLSVCVWARGPFGMRAFAAYGFLTCLGGVTLSGSRTGIVSMFVAILVFIGISLAFVYHMRRRDFWMTALVAGIVFSVVMTAALAFMVRSETLSKRFEHLAGSGSGRLILWPAAYKQFKTNRDFGTGSGTSLLYGRQLRDRPPAYAPEHVHNDYLEMLAEYGLAGAGLMGVFLVVHLGSGTIGLRRVILRKLRHGSRTKSNEMALLTGAVCGTVALIVHSFTDSNLHVPANALLVAFLFGIIANPTAESAEAQAFVSGRWLRFVVPVVSIFLLVKAWPRVPIEYETELARIAARSGEHEEVIAIADRALQREPANPELRYHRGEAQSRLALQKDDAAERETLLRGAVASFEASLKSFPQDSQTWAALARALDQLRQFDQAGQAFQQALILEPGSAEIYTAYGVHWQLQDQIVKANECFERARTLRGISTPRPKRPAVPPVAPPPVVDPEPRPAPNLTSEPAPGSGTARPMPAKKPQFFTQ